MTPFLLVSVDDRGYVLFHAYRKCKEVVRERGCDMGAGLELEELGGEGSTLDPGIRETVLMLRANGVETYESCEGTRGHCFPEPTVRFHGNAAEGFRAFSVALQHGLRPVALRRFWEVLDGEPTGPKWEMTFHHPTGGGLHAVEQPGGGHVFEWGPVERAGD